LVECDHTAVGVPEGAAGDVAAGAAAGVVAVAAGVADVGGEGAGNYKGAGPLVLEWD